MLVLPKYQKMTSCRGLNQASFGSAEEADWDSCSVSVWPSSIDAGVRVHFQSWSATRDLTSSFDLIETVCVFWQNCAEKSDSVATFMRQKVVELPDEVLFVVTQMLMWKAFFRTEARVQYFQYPSVTIDSEKTFIKWSIFACGDLPIHFKLCPKDIFLSTSFCVSKNMKSCSFHQSKDECISDFS